jgi:hypothetical protein
VECLELGYQNGGDMCESCAAAEAEVVVVVDVVVVGTVFTTCFMFWTTLHN